MRAAWKRRWAKRVNGAYTFNKATYLGSGGTDRDTALEITPGSQVIRQPRNTLVASADWQGQAWAFGISGRYLGKRYLEGVDGIDSAFIAAPRTVGLTLTLDM